MKYIEAQKLLENNISRGAMMAGFGCLTYFVPKKQVKEFTTLLNYYLPVGVTLEVLPLNTTCKKGVYEYWQPSEGNGIPDLIIKASKEK